MMLGLRRGRPEAPAGSADAVAAFLDGFSIEVMPRTAARVGDFGAILPAGTRVYLAHLHGTPISDMVATARRLNADGFPVMPHFPARIVENRAVLREWIAMYRGEADVRQALVLAGGVSEPYGEFHSSMQLLETGLFDEYGFTDVHVAGHPEGNRDIDPDGGHANVSDALRWKQDFARRTDARMAIVTQFVFEAGPVRDWARTLRAAGITLPIHIGVAGPAKLQTLIKFAIACGVGPSLRVLQKRATDLTKLLVPFEPTDLVADLARIQADEPALGIEKVHLFPLGGIEPSAAWAGQKKVEE